MTEATETMPVAQESVISLVSQLPVVTSIFGWSSQYYKKAKSSNNVVKVALETAEKSLQMAANGVKPVVHKLNKPLAAVDKVACQAFTKLQETYPSVNKTPEEIAAGAKAVVDSYLPTAQYENLKEYGVQKMTAIKDYGSRTASDVMATRYGQVLSTTFGSTLQMADRYLEYYVPSDAEESDETRLNEDDAACAKLTKLSTKLQIRIGATSLKMQDKVRSSITSTQQFVQGYVAVLQFKAKLIRDEFAKELDATEKQISDKSFGDILKMAYNASFQSISSAPQYLRTALSGMQQYRERSLDQLSKAVSFWNPLAIARRMLPAKTDLKTTDDQDAQS